MSPAGSARLAGTAEFAAELCTLKRIRTAEHPESIASRQFRRAWGALMAGEAPERVALAVTADTVAAIRLGGIDASVLRRVGVDANAARTVLAAAIGEALPEDHLALRQWAGVHLDERPSPQFVDSLVRQPRAGATCPGKPRIILEPPETHGDHCLAVAVLGVVLSRDYDGDPVPAFLAGLAHHGHNAIIPDSGFAGERLLGEHLAPAMAAAFDMMFAALPVPLATSVRSALSEAQTADTPVGRAFNAADVIDRVQEMRHFERVASFTADQALDDMQLVHEGPLQGFHFAVLREAGLA